ncbi:class I SAM-dependent methyltransferase [Shimia sp.]|jgi:2-polyprenyl-3-methyl-5-hydroxy-6-metoxy-1,4-benzoquinol methylase|uniref:class I SAM-dependent methyltransferase n=1 Tax=unclassified Shimia TaxID=2630038 RepID=UPI0025E532B1|nr:class I SAM-dependent methyltransferase [Shimia sp.]MCH2067098.1 class I SAM-dependent methyltransferase [Shimia sp.]
MHDGPDPVEEMRQVNVQQKAYYEATSAGWISPVNSFATNLWSRLRRRAMVAVSHEAREAVYDTHKAWLGDLSDKKVLDLGAGAGSPLSGYLAHHAKAYHAVELSGMQLDQLRANIGTGPTRHFIEADFLDPASTDSDFDVIYAHAVVHHFRYLDVLLDASRDKLVPGGQMITYDPCQTWLPIRLFRALFRPFQSDAAWEFPLTRPAMNSIETRFLVSHRLGVFNRGKWALILGIFAPKLAQKHGDRLFLADFEPGADTRLTSSLHVSYDLRKP